MAKKSMASLNNMMTMVVVRLRNVYDGCDVESYPALLVRRGGWEKLEWRADRPFLYL